MFPRYIPFSNHNDCHVSSYFVCMSLFTSNTCLQDKILISKKVKDGQQLDCKFYLSLLTSSKLVMFHDNMPGCEETSQAK